MCSFGKNTPGTQIEDCQFESCDIKSESSNESRKEAYFRSAIKDDSKDRNNRYVKQTRSQWQSGHHLKQTKPFLNSLLQVFSLKKHLSGPSYARNQLNSIFINEKLHKNIGPKEQERRPKSACFNGRTRAQNTAFSTPNNVGSSPLNEQTELVICAKNPIKTDSTYQVSIKNPSYFTSAHIDDNRKSTQQASTVFSKLNVLTCDKKLTRKNRSSITITPIECINGQISAKQLTYISKSKLASGTGKSRLSRKKACQTISASHTFSKLTVHGRPRNNNNKHSMWLKQNRSHFEQQSEEDASYIMNSKGDPLHKMWGTADSYVTKSWKGKKNRRTNFKDTVSANKSQFREQPHLFIEQIHLMNAKQRRQFYQPQKIVSNGLFTSAENLPLNAQLHQFQKSGRVFVWQQL